MLERREGFTLIELLIVVVIIGILAAIAIPKFARVREKAYFSAMKSDLKNMQAAQEIYHSEPVNNYSYASTLANLQFTASSGVTLTPVATSPRSGWGATASHAGLLTTQTCGVYIGTGSAGAPATNPGIVTCTGE